MMSNVPAKAERACVICGAQFPASPSSKVKTCSPACATAQRKATHTGKHRSAEDRNTMRESAKRRGVTPPPLVGTQAALRSPIAGPFETNQEAKIWWILRLSDGRHWRVRNLNLWCREHADLFAPDPWQNAAAGLRQVQRWLNHTAPRKVSHWKDWTLTQSAMHPDDNEEHSPNAALPHGYQTQK